MQRVLAHDELTLFYTLSSQIQNFITFGKIILKIIYGCPVNRRQYLRKFKQN